MSSEPWIDPPSRERTRSIDEFQQAGDLDDQTIAQIYTAIADGPSRLQQAVQLYLHQYHPQTQHHTRAQRRGGSAGADTLTDEKEEEDDDDDINDKLESTSLSRPIQNPTFLLYPSLPASPFHATSTLSWCSTLTSAHADITTEFCKLWTTQRHTFTNVTYNLDGGSWAIYPIVNQGLIDSAAASACPVTTSLIREASSVITTDCSLGYVYFSVITPGTKITPHTGVCNLKLRGHLGLIIPDPEKYDCSITVANETHTWKEGECLLFDDSYQHSVRHVPRDGVTPKPIDTLPTETSSQITALRDSGLRVVLLFDYWHPALSEKEIQVVRTFLRAS